MGKLQNFKQKYFKCPYCESAAYYEITEHLQKCVGVEGPIPICDLGDWDSSPGETTYECFGCGTEFEFDEIMVNCKERNKDD